MIFPGFVLKNMMTWLKYDSRMVCDGRMAGTKYDDVAQI